jgi:CBS domain-containing protein
MSEDSGKIQLQPLSSLFLHTTAAQLVATKATPMVTVSSNTSMIDVLSVLATNKILSAPVVEGGKMIGFIDVLDIVAFMLETQTSAPAAPNANDWYQTLLSLSQFGYSALTQSPVSAALNKSGNDIAHSVHGRTTLFEVTKYFLAEGVHRVAVTDDGNTVIGILTQSEVVKYLTADLKNLGKLAKKTVEELHLGVRNVLRVTMDTQVIKAFELMKNNKVSAVAVVDNVIENNLIGNLSASDIRGVQVTIFSSLMLPLVQFFAMNPGMFKPPMTCKLSTTVETIVTKMVLFRMHRVWIVDNKDVPIGVISLTDIMQLLSKAVEDDAEQPPFFRGVTSQ